MKKIVLSSLVAICLYADVNTVLPYSAKISYDTDKTKSAKDDGTINGLYYSRGNLGYLFELDYAKTDIKYKNSATKNLKQDDITIAYSKYYPKYKFTLGLHHINTTDTDLGDGDVLIASIGGYKWVGYNKHDYGIETYYSKYKDGHDESAIAKSIGISQITPYYSYSKAINISTRNNISIKANYIKASDYKTTSYTSYEVEDVLFYKKYTLTLKAYNGKMKSGIKDGGHTVYNSKDLLKSGYSLKVGYAFKPNLSASVSYAQNNFEEYFAQGTASNNVSVLSMSYTF